MILLKGFFRKKRTKNTIMIISIILTILILINSFKNYSSNLYNEIQLNSQSFIVFSNKDYNNVINSSKLVKSSYRALTFNPSKDNEIIKTSTNDDYILTWNNLLIHDIILAYSSSYCDNSIPDDEMILGLDEEYYNKEELINKEINFKYNDKNLTLKIKDLNQIKGHNYICISDNLYDQLIKEEKNYIYTIEPYNYTDIDRLPSLFSDLNKDNFYGILNIERPMNEENINAIEYLQNIIGVFNVINIIFLIVSFIILIFVIKDFLLGENKEIVLLKQVGFNRFQNITNLFIKVIFLDIAILIMTLILIFFILFLLHFIIKIPFNIINIKGFILILLLIIIVELISCILNFSKKNIK